MTQGLTTFEDVFRDLPPAPPEHSQIQARLETLATQRADAEREIAVINHEVANLRARLAELAVGVDGGRDLDDMLRPDDIDDPDDDAAA